MVFDSVTNIRQAIFSKYHLIRALISVEFKIIVNASDFRSTLYSIHCIVKKFGRRLSFLIGIHVLYVFISLELTSSA